MSRTREALLVALLAAECGPLKCPVARLQHAVSRVETLLRDEFGFSETAKELGRLREGIEATATISLPLEANAESGGSPCLET